MFAYTKRGKKVEDDFWDESGLTFGASAAQIAAALDDIDFWSNAQMENFDNKTVDWIDYCHRQIAKINSWLDYNTRRGKK